MKLSVVLSAQPAGFEAATFKGDLEDNLAAIAALGYQGVELAIREPAALDQDALLAAVERHGLSISAIGTGQAWGEEGLSFTDPEAEVRERAVDRIAGHMPLAARAGAVVILGLIRGRVRSGVEPGKAMDWLVEALRRVGAAAADAGVRLALEPINRYETDLVNRVDQGLDLLERVGAESLGLLLDTFHMNIEEPSPLDGISSAGRRLFHFHVADSNRHRPGAGHLDFGRILQALDAIGYAGWVSGEFLPVPDARTAARDAIAHLRSARSEDS